MGLDFWTTTGTSHPQCWLAPCQGSWSPEDLEIGDPVEDRYRRVFMTYCADDMYLAFGLPILTRLFDASVSNKSALAVEHPRFR